MQKIARMQAEFLVDAIKNDNELADIMFPPRCMNIEEASEYLRIPVSTLYNKIGEIPHEKVGKRLVFTDRGLMRWMKRSKATNIVELSIRKVM